MVRAGLRLDMQNSSQERRRNSAPEGWRKTARRHHPNPAEAHRRWRGERSKPVRLGVRDHHTRSLCAQSPAQTEQWCCWLLPPADHLLIERDRGQFVPSRRRRMMANVRVERLLKIPAEPSPELLIPGAAAQTRVVSMAAIRLRASSAGVARASIPAEILAYARAAYPQRRSSNANSLQRQNSAGFRQICSIFQRDNLLLHC